VNTGKERKGKERKGKERKKRKTKTKKWKGSDFSLFDQIKHQNQIHPPAG